MVDMGMGHQDMADGHAIERPHQGSQMVILQRAGIDHGDLVAADQIGAGALEGIGAGIVGDDTADQRAHHLNGTVFDRQVFVEIDLVRHHALCLAS